MKKKKKKCLRLFNKKTPLYAGLGTKQKTFSNCQGTYQKQLCLLFENQALFSQSECTDRLDPPFLLPPPLFVLVRFLRTPLPPSCTTNVLFE